jgi:hypothetical protein
MGPQEMQSPLGSFLVVDHFGDQLKTRRKKNRHKQVKYRALSRKSSRTLLRLSQ